MVVEKTQKNWLEDQLEETKRRLERETVKFNWCVVEKTPGYNTGGYYGVDVPDNHRVVSEYFNTEEEAASWLENHEPDPGNTLYIQRMRLLKTEITRWVTY